MRVTDDERAIANNEITAADDERTIDDDERPTERTTREAIERTTNETNETTGNRVCAAMEPFCRFHCLFSARRRQHGGHGSCCRSLSRQRCELPSATRASWEMS